MNATLLDQRINRPRILFVDDNIRDVGGHYLELACQLAAGARELGYSPHLSVHSDFDPSELLTFSDHRLTDIPLTRDFDVRRLENGSLGVDGYSVLRRDFDAKPIGGGYFQRLVHRVTDRLKRQSRRPSFMLQGWAEGFSKSIEQFSPIRGDQIVINTGGDFQLLALAAALRNYSAKESLSLHVIFHFAVYEGVLTGRARAFGQQVKEAIESLKPHRIHLHATTRALANQLGEVGVQATPIPYPTRKDLRSTRLAKIPMKIVLAGIPRAEKGRSKICGLLSELQKSHLVPGPFQCSLQMPTKRWERMVPETMHETYRLALQSPSPKHPLEVVTGDLTSEHYHRWLNSADVGLFLYEPKRYVARCSGVLLEMLIRGVPVIVPDDCWLADCVKHYSKDGPVGYVYQSTDQITNLLDELQLHADQIRRQCSIVSERIAQEHCGVNTIRTMGIRNADSNTIRKAG